MGEKEKTDYYGQPKEIGYAVDREKAEDFLSDRYPSPFSSWWYKYISYGLLSGFLIGGLLALGFWIRWPGPRAGSIWPGGVDILLILPWLGLAVVNLICLVKKWRRARLCEQFWDLLSKAIRSQKKKGKVNVAQLAGDSGLSEGEVHELLLDCVDRDVVQGNLNLS